MFNFKHTFIIKNPAGTYSYVGRVPTVLGELVPATRDDIMAGRSHTYPGNGKAYTYKFPVFEHYADAVAHAVDNGVAVQA